jgi:hypothetical protein
MTGLEQQARPTVKSCSTISTLLPGSESPLMKSKELQHPRNQTVSKRSQQCMRAQTKCISLSFAALPLTILFASALISPAQDRNPLPGSATNPLIVDNRSFSSSQPNKATGDNALPAGDMIAEGRADGTPGSDGISGALTPTRSYNSLLVQAPVAEPQQPEITANPGRPSMSTSALLTPIGYAQFENGVLYAAGSAEFSKRGALEETMRVTLTQRVQLILASEPIASSQVVEQQLTQQGDTTGGMQVVLIPGQAVKPTISVSYLRLLRGGNATNLDIGGFTNSALFMASNDMGHFHVDANGFLNETAGPIRRMQFGQAVAVTHPLTQKLSATAELRHFSEPLTAGDGLSAMWAVGYTVRPNLVLDAGVARGFNGTSTNWQMCSGVTYVLPRRLWGSSPKTVR